VDVRVELRKGGLEAYASVDSAPFHVGAAAGRVCEELRKLGATTVDEQRIAAALEECMAQPLPDGRCAAVVARGEPPRPGIEAQLLPLFPVRETPVNDGKDPLVVYARNLAYPGDTLLKKTTPSDGVPGRSLLGTPIPAPAGADLAVSCGDGVFEEPPLTYRSATYGVVLCQESRLQVKPAIWISEDRMEARISVLPDPKRDRTGHYERLLQALKELGVTHGIDEEALRSAVAQAAASQAPVLDVVVARGQEPVEGRDAEYRMAIDLERKAFKVLEGDRIDYREMETVKNVSKGEVLAERLPATEPVPGFCVDGTALKAGYRRVTSLTPGDNTVVDEERKLVLADADGMIVLRSGQFHVVDQYLVPGDVDLSTGNIRATGSVRVKGQVKPGFIIQAGKNVEISDDVCKGTVEAKGSIRVGGGITAGSRIVAGKNLSARYVLNSRIEADGDVEVALSVTGSEIYARGKLTVAGSQGVILGGEVNAALGVEARTIGAPNSRTRIAVGVNLKDNREMEAARTERLSIMEELKALQSKLGKDFLADPKRALVALPPALRKPKLEVLQQMQNLRKRADELAHRLDELVATVMEAQDARIEVSGEIHAGTSVTIGPAKSVLAETLRRVALVYDPKANCVVWRKL
jgi:uncharacterized protein (DUF342 family)